MVRCPNCGQNTSGDYCEWCNYPILKRRVKRRQKAKAADLAAREKARQDAIDAKKAKQAEERAGKEADLAAREKAKQDTIDAEKAKQAEERAGKEAGLAPGEKTNIYQGNLNLVVQSPKGYEQVWQFEQYLKGLENLKILWTGGSQDEGAIIAISVPKPTPLIQLLSETPIVEQVAGKERNIVVMLKTPDIS